MLPPFEEVGIAVDVHDQRHVRVLSAAELGALAAEHPDALWGDADVRLAPGDEVLLACKTRHPEAVNYVV